MNPSFRKKVMFVLSAAVFIIPGGAWSATATIDFSKTHQTIDGFGGSSAWCPAYNATTADALFGNNATQLGYTILRVRIDPSNNNWATEKNNATLAKARGATVFATPWSPPVSMKSGTSSTTGGSINPAQFANFATWMKSFWTYCGTDNIDIMSLQNEPNWVPTSYEGCQWTGQNFLDFCKTYAPAIGKPIMMPESMNYDFSFSDPTLNDSTAAANITYMGGHLYGAAPKTYTLALNKGKHVWETEHYYDNDNASSCMSLAKEVMDCMNCSFSAYAWWWMTYSSTEALYFSGSPTHRGWVLAQFSKWVRPGFVRVDATYSPQSGVNVVAFKGATGTVIVAMNNSTSSQSVTFACSNAALTSVTKYTSSQSKSAADDGDIAVTNNSFTTTLDAQCVSTFVSTGGVSVLSPYKGTESADGFGIPLPINSAAHFAYLLNGKRFNFQGISEQEHQASGIFILPNTLTGNGMIKSVIISKK